MDASDDERSHAAVGVAELPVGESCGRERIGGPLRNRSRNRLDEQGDGRVRAAAGDRQHGTLSVGKRSCERQADPGAVSHAAREGPLGVLIEPGALVGDLERERVTGWPHRHGHRAGTVAKGVVDQDVEDLIEDRDGDSPRRDWASGGDPQRTPGGGEAPMPAFAHPAERVAELDVCRLVAWAVAGVGQQGGDRRLQPLGLSACAAGQAADVVALAVEHALEPASDCLVVFDDQQRAAGHGDTVNRPPPAFERFDLALT